MKLTLTGQIKKLLEDKKYVLIVFPKNGNFDLIASSIALSLLFKKMNKKVDIVSDGFICPREISFLPDSTNIKKEFCDLKNCIIKINLKENGLKNMWHEINNNELKIFITPEKGNVAYEQISTMPTKFKYDLIVTVGTKDLSSLGSLFENHAELFYGTPILDIDYGVKDSYFANVNFINMNAASVAETTTLFINKISPENLDKKIAEALLTGIIANTKSFQSANTRPKTLLTATMLMDIGANQQTIVQRLYKNKKLSALRLWGEALTNLQYIPECKMVWSIITRENFAKTGADEQDLNDIFDDLILTSPEAKIAFLLYERDGENKQKFYGVLRALQPFDALKIIKELRPDGNEDSVSFAIENRSLKAAEEEIINLIKKNFPLT